MRVIHFHSTNAVHVAVMETGASPSPYVVRAIWRDTGLLLELQGVALQYEALKLARRLAELCSSAEAVAFMVARAAVDAAREVVRAPLLRSGGSTPSGCGVVAREGEEIRGRTPRN